MMPGSTKEQDKARESWLTDFHGRKQCILQAVLSVLSPTLSEHIGLSPDIGRTIRSLPCPTLCKEVLSTSWKGAGSILQSLKLTGSSSCCSSHSKI